MEIAIFLIIAWLMTRTKTWNKGPKVSDYIKFHVLIASCLDAGPMRYGTETAQEDPNSNPDYIWYERS